MMSVRDILRSYAVFDAQGRHVNGTDKESNHHYGNAYESLFPDRSAVRLLMEVGVADGSCLLAWREVFPNATIVGMDIHPSARASGERLEFHLGDMRVRLDCEKAARGRMFDVIIDDGTHLLEDTLRTLFFMWPFVRPGGMYVVEEFTDVLSSRHNILALWPSASIVGTCGPLGQDEPLVVLRKPS